MMEDERKLSFEPYIVLYDGECAFCNRSVMFIIQHDRKKKFLFTSLQSDKAEELLQPFDFRPSLDSMMLLKNGKYFERSDAALEITRYLSGAWPLIYAFKIVPRFIRDAVYRWIAEHRHQWFGKDDACALPTPEMESRFL